CDFRARGAGRLHDPPAVRRGRRKGIRAEPAVGSHLQRARSRGGRDDPRYRPGRGRGARRRAKDLPDFGLERPARRFRGAAFRRGDGRAGKDSGGTDQGRFADLGGGRRRYGRGAQPRRRDPGFHLRLHRGRRIPRVDGRAGPARRRSARAAMICIVAIDHVVFRVVDLDRVSRFYIDVLGATWEKKQEDIGLYQLRVGSALVDLVPVDGKLGQKGGAAPRSEGRNVDHVCFRVLPWDGEAILAHLRGHGIEGEIVTRYGAEGDGPSIYLADPEGNVLELKGPPEASS